MMLQNDRPDATFRMWSALLEEGPETAPWIAPIRDQIADVAWRAGVKYDPPAPAAAPGALSGPSAADMANAADMTPEERQEMVRGMVAQLSERLATEGGTPQEWARLISAYGVLGETDRAAAIWGEAQQVFAAKPDALEIVRQGAERAGVTDAAPAGAPLKGPTTQDMQNAAQMSPEDRQAMIRNMVDQLSERLTTEGGSAAEWARLIGAQNVLGDTEAARSAFDAARAAHAGDDAALAAITQAARDAGLIE
jgi:cytochrome c-type biogenesis protein CcmH